MSILRTQLAQDRAELQEAEAKLEQASNHHDKKLYRTIVEYLRKRIERAERYLATERRAS
jgi:phosphoenolpyruvate carboxylase